MATLEQFGVLCQINDQLYRLGRNLRANCQSYIDLAGRGVPAEAIADSMHGDAVQFLRRLQGLTDAAARNQTLVQQALAIIGVTLAQANTVKNELVTACAHMRDAQLTTAQECVDEANWVIAHTTAFDGLF